MKSKIFVLFCISQTISALRLSDNPLITTRVVGGDIAEDGVAPFQCSLQVDKGHHCGCSVISHKWIVTAAHCTKEFEISRIRILVGTNSLKAGAEYYDVEEKIEHEKYFDPPLAYDIAVVRVNGSIEFSEKVQPIKLSTKELPVRTEIQLTGWGATSDDGSTWPDQLMIAHLNKISTDECRDIFKKVNVSVHEGHMCTFKKVGLGACFADSGGPLVFDNELVGIVNFGNPPCGSGYPDGCAKVAYFYDWITKHTDLD